jgi:hypothetical protein
MARRGRGTWHSAGVSPVPHENRTSFRLAGRSAQQRAFPQTNDPGRDECNRRGIYSIIHVRFRFRYTIGATRDSWRGDGHVRLRFDKL